MFGDDVLDLRYYRWMYGSVDGIDVVISRTGYSSELGFEVYLLGNERGDELWEIILAAGKPLGLAPGSPNRIRRIEGGVLDYGSDILPSNNPYELGLDRLVDLDKPEFIGRHALDRIHAQGVQRRIAGVFMDGAPFERNNEHRWPVERAGDCVGEVTAAVYSPRLARNIGFAYLDGDVALPGERLEVDTQEGRRRLEVTTLPFIDPEKKLPRQPLR